MVSTKVLKGLGASAAIALLVIGALPTTTAYMQGKSPLPTPPPTVAPPKPTPQPTIRPTTPPVKSTPVPDEPEPQATAMAPRTVKAVPAPKLITKHIQESNAKAFYEIDVKYPAIDNPAPAWKAFNTLAEKAAQDSIAAFKKDVSAAGAITPTAAPTSTLTTLWEAFRVTRDFISVRSTISVYMAGAAHPNTVSQVLNFDPRTGKALALSDLFKQVNTDYLGTLSTYCKRQLTREGKLDFPGGASPKPENYANWNIGRLNLVISFDPYQVAPYSAGRVECQVPLRSLRRLLADPRRW